MGQSWNAGSASLARESLEVWWPTLSDSLAASDDRPLQSEHVRSFVRDFTRRAGQAKCELVLAYYVGHSLINRAGKTALLMGNADREQVESFVRSDGRLLVEPPDTLLPLADLHETFKEGGVPFMLLLDGCMDFNAVREALLEKAFQFDPLHPGNIHYVGPKELLGPGDFEVISASLKGFGRNEPCLTDSNPIVFASKPGTFARARPNPVLIGGPAIGPLANRIHASVQDRLASAELLPGLDELIEDLNVWRGLGEIGMEGPISWSDFATFEANARRFRPAGLRSNGSASAAVLRRLEPGLGPIEDLAYDPNRKTAWLQIKTVEPSGRNRWDIWRWPSGEAAVRVLEDVLFPKIAFGGAALAVYREPGNTRELVRLGPPRSTEILMQDLWITCLSPGYAAGSLLVVEADNIVDQGGDRLHRITPGGHSVVFSQELSQAGSMIELAPDMFAWLADNHDGAIEMRTAAGPVRTISVGDVRLAALAGSGNSLFALDMARERLFRIRLTGEVEFAWLLDPSDHPLVHFQFGGGGMWVVGEELWLADNTSLLCLNPQLLTWSKVPSKP